MTHPHHPAPGTVPVGGWTPWGTWDPAAGQPLAPLPTPEVPAARAGLGGAAVVAAGLVVGLVLAAVVAAVLLRGVAEDAGRAAGEAMGTSVADALYGGATDPFVGGTLGEVEQSAPVAPGDLGPDPVLDGYAQQCFDGDLQSCDDLFADSPPLSDYEEYALTCGGRVKAWSVVYCTELE
ncbi:hypothetical protein SAMN04488107_2777 [Geodermatophilus saharensis]|uniref:Uncharacterized protein n=1 Tax=Geodermatophilus saharensis TaxID=1137994 RepID=A0A239F0Y2_9ACTN|nr:hypothetical protein [Geodermatophilus saharensis]SNS50361.1 hypothetical protein SAMN04488107_2777 [Geodermatophilus saharensis]